jgi:hypothetical protein
MNYVVKADRVCFKFQVFYAFVVQEIDVLLELDEVFVRGQVFELVYNEIRVELFV